MFRGDHAKLQFVGGSVTFFVVASALMTLLLSPDLLSSTENVGNLSLLPSSNTVIGLENTHLGTSSWKIPNGREATNQLQAYAGATSVQPGQKLTFYVSTEYDGTPYLIAFYRLGWYGGYGGRLMTSTPYRVGYAQGYYDEVNLTLVNCKSCRFDAKTRLIEANWQPSYTLKVPSNWVTGVYLAKFIDTNGWQTYVPFDVRGNTLSRYVVVTPDTTDAAYNRWGSWSLYEGDGGTRTRSQEALQKLNAVKVSFDRPYLQGNGSGQVLSYEVNAIHWLERQGYDLSFISDVDLHENPAQLLHHRAYLSLGHDEYWTKEMRGGVENARNHGVGLAFLGADAVYWQMRFEPDSKGIADRTIVCYKVSTALNNLSLDPMYGKDNTRVTTEWRDPVLRRPENALIGIMFSSLTSKRQGFQWHLNAQAKGPLLVGTGLKPGKNYDCSLVGYEWDHVFNNGATPAGLQVLATSPTLNDDGSADFSNTTYYIAPSGAMVFATGSIYWELSLDAYRYQTDNSYAPGSRCASGSLEQPAMQKLMANVMDALVSPHRIS
jgi:hypothetical protein